MISEKERENRDKLFQLMRENPDLPVVPMVCYDVVCDDSYSYWMGNWGAVHIGEYYINGQVHFRDDDDWEAVEKALLAAFGLAPYNSMSDEQAKEAYANLPWIEAIIVNIESPEV